MHIGLPSARRSRFQWMTGSPSVMLRARATPGPACSRRASSVTDSASIPRRAISSL